MKRGHGLLPVVPGPRPIHPPAARAWTLALLFGAAFTPACVTPKPVATPPPTVSSPPVEAPAPVVQSSPVTQAAEPPPIIIHHADLHGRFEHKQGSTITIRALLMMTKTQPEVGNKGVLYCSAGEGKEEEWVALGDVEVKKQLDADGRIQLKITGDEKKFVHPGKKGSPLVKNTRMRLSWEW
jgi:hypothetical protein